MPSERYLTQERRTKRGNRYNTRRTKLATGFSKVLADRRTKAGTWDDPKTNLLRRLSLFGTLDEIARKGNAYKQLVTKHHPVDPDYTKKAWILTHIGRLRLEVLRRRAAHK